MQGFIFSLILAAISSLAFIAYRHHKAFVKINVLLLLASLITYLAINLWNIAIIIAGTAAQSAVEYQGSDQIQHAIDQLLIPFGVLTISFFLWMTYLTVLRFLPQILHLDKEEKG